MKIQQLREHIERFVTEPGEEMGRWARFVRSQLLLWRYCAKRLYEHDVMSMSAALSFRTIFAMVPVMVLALLIAKSVGVLEDSKQSLNHFLEASGFSQIIAVQEEPPPAGGSTTPAAGPERRTINVASEIENIVNRVEDKLTFARIGPVGGIVLIWTALGLLSSMEYSLNRIFGAPHGRSFVRRILLYWSAMTLGPILLAVASYLGRLSVQTFGHIGGVSWLLALGGRVGPVLVGIAVVAALYKLMPKTTVPYRAALGGATVAMLLWVVAKWGFALYVDRLVLKGNLYGMLGVLPLFFLWLYYSWLIFLFGAELAHTAAHLAEMEMDEEADRMVLGPSDVLATAVAVVQSYQAGCGPVSLQEVAARLKLPAPAVQGLLDRLLGAQLVCTVDDTSSTRYMPARPPEHIAVQAVMEIADPQSATDSDRIKDGAVARALADVHNRTRSALAAMTLADMLKTRGE